MFGRALLTASTAALLFGASQAAAHPRFVSSSPARGAVVASPPKEIRVTFSETVRAEGSTFQLTDAAGKAVRTGPLQADARDKRTVVLPVAERLPPGSYKIQWRVAAAGHSSVPGRLAFTVVR